MRVRIGSIAAAAVSTAGGAFILASVSTPASAASASAVASGDSHWIASWASAQQVPEPRNALPAGALRDVTLREIVHLTLGGEALRIRFSNAFGTAPLHIDSAHVARPLSLAAGDIDSASDRALSFSGNPGVTIPAGSEYLSDPIHSVIPPQSDLAVTFHLQAPSERETGHPGSRETSFLARGDRVSAAALPDALRVDHWYFLSGVEVAAPATAASVVALGDSITDGHGSTTNGNDRWPDDLARRFAAQSATTAPSASGPRLGVVNAGIGGNRLLEDGLGPNALARFDRDVLAQAGVRGVIVLEGINDLGVATSRRALTPEAHRELVGRMISAYAQLVARAHAHGIRVLGGTLTPDGGSAVYQPDAAAEADRQAVNGWIRVPGHFDGVVDFDAVLRDPVHPDRLAPAYDSGDHLHPSPAGYRAMADAVPLPFFECTREPAVAPATLLMLAPLEASGIYARGERVGWTVSVTAGTRAPAGSYTYTVKENDDTIVAQGAFDMESGGARIETVVEHPAMLYVTIERQPPCAPSERIATGGAAVDPTGLEPTARRPADFDAFWDAKLAALARVPIHPVLVRIPSPRAGVELYRVRLDSVGSHVQGYLAVPAHAGRFPALVIYQYAGVYALDPRAVTERAAEGWLAFDVDSHDLPPDQGTGVPTDYASIGDTDRDTSYFLAMYLRDTRALDYIETNRQWDGRTIVLLGTSMGGQQSLVTAGLNPHRVTAVLVNEPSGADSNGALHGRYVGYPWWHTTDPRVLHTALYFDTVNFASRIRAPSVVTMGFIDRTVPPAGVWTALNQIPAPKEAIPLVQSDHNNYTPEKQTAWYQRSEEVLATLLAGRPFHPDPRSR
jgi:cephalosporin-C deacetylase-like acetyl esterase/lysophospholipase L1-like esterase